MSKKTAKRDGRIHKREPRKPPLVSALIALGALLLIALLGFALFRSSSTGQSAKPDGAKPATPAASSSKAQQLAYEVVGSYPHDPAAFLQGLLWHDGGFYESTGLEGHSTLRRVDFPSGRVVKSISLAPDIFAEGLALVGDHLIQLTWKAHRGFVYDRETFRLLREFSYETEGWGITYDGKDLIMSDGSDRLTYLDPATYQPTHRLAVTMNGNPVHSLNELEFIEGEIWANVWQTDLILRIDPATGQVSSYLNLKGILPPSAQTGNEDVLNGIAYDPKAKRIFVSGKLWPRLFEIRVK
jgi:glutamine cyclotransferase